MAAEHSALDTRRPALLDFLAALLLLATVVLHVVAMAPTYFVGSGSLMSQPDQAALYSVLAASWALALGIGLTGPHRTPVAAAVAVGVAATELGFRVADLGDALRYGISTVGAGLWLMEAAWVVGAAAAVLAVLAARSRHRAKTDPDQPEPSEWNIDWAAPVPAANTNPYDPQAPTGEATEAASEPAAVTAAAGPHEANGSASLPPGGDTVARRGTPGSDDDPHERTAWTLLVVILAIVVAGAFLPAWDHAVAVSTQTGQTVTRSLGNAFSGPWQQVVGTVLAAVALLVVPVVAIRLRNKAVGAGLAAGSLLVLATQLVAAVVQVGESVPPADFGISPGQAHNLGLQLSLKLTGWFTVDALAAYALFAAVMVWATLRTVQDSSAGAPPNTPEVRSEAMRSAS